MFSVKNILKDIYCMDKWNVKQCIDDIMILMCYVNILMYCIICCCIQR